MHDKQTMTKKIKREIENTKQRYKTNKQSKHTKQKKRWHWGIYGPDNGDNKNWDQWFLPSSGKLTFEYALSKDCNSCDTDDTTGLSYYMNGNQFGWYGFVLCGVCVCFLLLFGFFFFRSKKKKKRLLYCQSVVWLNASPKMSIQKCAFVFLFCFVFLDSFWWQRADTDCAFDWDTYDCYACYWPDVDWSVENDAEWNLWTKKIVKYDLTTEDITSVGMCPTLMLSAHYNENIAHSHDVMCLFCRNMLCRFFFHFFLGVV